MPNIIAEENKIHITKRELEVIQGIALDLQSHEIAEKMFVSRRTIDFHIANIFTKLRNNGYQVSSKIGIYRYALKHGIVQL